jgi:cell division protein FtsI/penicillin-binding protein 2
MGRRGAHAAARPNSLFVPARRAPQPAASGRAPLTGGTGGTKVSGRRTRRPPLRLIAAVVAVVFGAVGFYGGLWSSSSAEPTVQTFLLDWDQGDYAAAAALTTGNPAAVAAQLRTAYRQLHAAAFYLQMGSIRQHSGTADAWFYASVDLGQDGAPWTYRGHFRLRQTHGTWKVLWSPAVINPGLRPGLRLAVVTRMPQRAQLLDANGRPLQVPSPVYDVGIRPGRLASPQTTAVDLARVTGLDPAALLGQIVAAPRTPFWQLLTLSPDDYARLRPGLAKVPGLVVKQQLLRLFGSVAPDVVGSVETETSPVLRSEGVSYHPGTTIGLTGLQRAYQSQLAGTPTTEVVAESPSGSQVTVLKRWPGHPSAPVRTTIDLGVQQAADNAAAAAPGSAGIVAVQAGTGRVLAVADHQLAGLPRVDPLAGQYPPGAAFTIVSTEALLATTQFQVTARLLCPTISPVGGTNFFNVPPVQGLGGTPPFSADFAHACGTAFTGLSRLLDGQKLAAAARGFGIGGRWSLPLRTFTGSLPVSGSVADVAAQTIGQGNVEVSPLGMALVAAQVDAGSWHPPTLTAGVTQSQAAARVMFPGSTIHTLRALMRTTVRSGVAAAADLPGPAVSGQVGVAQVSKRVWASWFVGYRGGVAFAVVVLSKSKLTSAVPTGRQFLSAVP